MWDVINRRTSLIREPNEVRILRLVRDKGEISRVEIAKACDLNRAYVSELVVKLIQTGFLEETGKVEARRKVGRRRILLKFRPLAGLVAGIDIGMTHTTVALTDLNSRILQQKTFNYSIDAKAEEVISKTATLLQTLIASEKIPQSKLVGIGVGVQGLIDYTTNTLMLSHNKKSWEGASLSSEFEARFNVPVYVENDVKAMTLGEYLLGSAKGTHTFVNIFVGDGLGMGIMINGHLHRGLTSSAGEIGYNALEFPEYYREKFPLTYRNQVMFGEILTNANFIESYRLHSGRSNEKDLTVQSIVERCNSGDEVAKQIIEEYSSLLSILSINLVNTLNPESIIIGGQLVQYCPPLAGMLQEKIHKDLLSVPAEAVKVKAAVNGNGGVVLGAASLVLYELFEPLHSTSLRATRKHKSAKSKTAEAV